MPVPRSLRKQAEVSPGGLIEVTIELDTDPRPLELPDELEAVFAEDPEAEVLFESLPPAHRRAWVEHVGQARRPETRVRRARKAPAGIRARAFPGEKSL